MSAENENKSSGKSELTTEQLAQSFASRVDSLIEKVGENPRIGTESYSLKNGGPTVEVGRSCSIEEDGGHIYDYSEKVVTTLPINGKPMSITGETAIGRTAFGKSSTGALLLEPTQLAGRMDRMISTVETFALQQASLPHQTSHTTSFPSPLSSAA